MRLFVKILLILLLILIIGYFLGPTAKYESVNSSPANLSFSVDQVESFVSNKEKSTPGIKPRNEAKIIWASAEKAVTEYAVVYLHGFTASHKEGFPIVQNFAARYNCNLYLPRLAKHGLADKDAMKDLTPKQLLDSAKEAIAVAKALGKKVIVFSTSTGSTYSSYLANEDKAIAAQIMLAPNFAINDPNSKKITGRWGKQLFKLSMGGDYRTWEANDKVKEYWQTTARIEGYIAMQALLDQTMTEETWKKNTVPTFIGYYYKDEAHSDKIISIPAIKRYAEISGIPEGKLVVKPFADAQGHVIGSQFMNDNWESVQNEIFKFSDDILQTKVVNSLVVTYPE